MNRFAPSLTALLLCATAASGCAGFSTDTADAKSSPVKTAASEAAKDSTPSDLDGNVRQAQLLRLAGDYSGAVRVLSQLMMVAADDPRVVAEYGKTLAQQGRAKDAVPFLNRAAELRGTDWTIFSAMGMAYDQLGDERSAANAYEHALQLHPADATVLNNYALSRMQAKDMDGAQKLMERARIAGGATNDQIARNMAMIQAISPEKAEAPKALAYDVKRPAPQAMAQTSAPQPVRAANAAQPQPFVTIPQTPVPQGAPRQLMPQQAPQQVSQAQPRVAPEARDNRVVMQRVPEDPLAGPIALHMPAPKKMAARAPRKVAVIEPVLPPLPHTAPAAKAETPKPADAKPVKQAAAAPQNKVVAPELPPLPSDKSAVKAKVAAAAAKIDIKPVAAADKPAPKVLDAKPVIKVADAKKKDEVPALRLAAGAY